MKLSCVALCAAVVLGAESAEGWAPAAIYSTIAQPHVTVQSRSQQRGNSAIKSVVARAQPKISSPGATQEEDFEFVDTETSTDSTKQENTNMFTFGGLLTVALSGAFFATKKLRSPSGTSEEAAPIVLNSVNNSEDTMPATVEPLLDVAKFFTRNPAPPFACLATHGSSDQRRSVIARAGENDFQQQVKANRNAKNRWKGMDNDFSDDQMDIARGRDMVDGKFQGGFGQSGTHNAIMQTSEYDKMGHRTLSDIADGFYICPEFLDKFTVHIVKNFCDLPKIKIPLILGIWGGKGQGKSFQCELAFKEMGIEPIMMSAGELESGNAGEPAKLVRQRYREASDMIKKGNMSALYINDLDAGAGRMGGSTQYTVNNQMVNATLMNIADNPTNVQMPGQYQVDTIPRVPIIVTGNDFSTLYAPLVRDGRMEKFYWNPTREDRIGVANGIFKSDGISEHDVEVLVDTFPGQSIDFFGALRARVYDQAVRDFIKQTGLKDIKARLVNSREGKVQFDMPRVNLEMLLAFGRSLELQQEHVSQVQLANAYLDGAVLPGSSGGGGGGGGGLASF